MIGQAAFLIQIDEFPINKRGQSTRWDYKKQTGSLITLLLPHPRAEYSISFFLLKSWW